MLCASTSTKLRPTGLVQHIWHIYLGDIRECTGVFGRNSSKKSDFLSIIDEIPFPMVAYAVGSVQNLVISMLSTDKTWFYLNSSRLLRLPSRFLPNTLVEGEELQLFYSLSKSVTGAIYVCGVESIADNMILICLKLTKLLHIFTFRGRLQLFCILSRYLQISTILSFLIRGGRLLIISIGFELRLTKSRNNHISLGTYKLNRRWAEQFSFRFILILITLNQDSQILSSVSIFSFTFNQTLFYFILNLMVSPLHLLYFPLLPL